MVSNAVHECKECEAKFSESSDLKHNMYIHTPWKTYKWQECDPQFSYSIEINWHEFELKETEGEELQEDNPAELQEDVPMQDDPESR